MDPKSWNEEYAEEIIQKKRPETPHLKSVQRMIGTPSASDAKQQPPRKMPRNLGLQAWEKFHAAATPETEAKSSFEAGAEPCPSVIVGGVVADSDRVQAEFGKFFSRSPSV